MIVAGHRIYDKCAGCGNLVQINKFLLGSLHICPGSEERRLQREALQGQQPGMPQDLQKRLDKLNREFALRSQR